MSAFCSTRRMLLVNENISTSPKPSITARPSPDEKRRFAELATRLRVSESTLALIAIRSLLDSNPVSVPAETRTSPPEQEPSTDRITIRLRPGDMRRLKERAQHRGIRVSGYIAACLRAHLEANPPLTIPELTILKEGVSVLSKLRRALTHTTQDIVQTGVLTPELQRELALTRTVVTALEQRIHDFTRSALKTWESRHE
jgi:hypothetical protein